MFPNDIKLAGPSGPITVTLHDLDNGKGDRRMLLPNNSELQLVTSRQETAENKPLGSRRILVRLNQTKQDSEGRPQIASFQQVFVAPKSDLFTRTELEDLYISYLSFFTQTEGDADTRTLLRSNFGYGSPTGAFLRLLTGEV